MDHLVRDLLTGELDLYLARSRMATIVSIGHPVPRWAVTISIGVMCAAVALFLGGPRPWSGSPSWPRPASTGCSCS